MSGAGIAAMLAFTLNEGLRFGRGIDYNLYGESFENLVTHNDSTQNIGFLLWEKTFVALDLPWQGCVMAMSFTYILALLFLLRNYKEVVALALPLFVLFSKDTVGNMVRWYLAFSFVLIGLSYLLRGEKPIKFILLSLIGCTIHYAMLPVPVLFFFLWKLKKPILPPFLSIPLFFAIALLFRTDYMMHLVDIANTLAMMSERFEHYGNRAEYWLTTGYSGRARPPMPGISEIMLSVVLIYYGYKLVKAKGKSYVYVYNLFVIGFMLRPIGMQIELVHRFEALFFCFRAIIVSYVVIELLVKKAIKVVPIIQILVVLIILNYGRIFITSPLGNNYPKKYLYVWNRGEETYDSMIQMWMDASNEKSEQLEKKQEE